MTFKKIIKYNNKIKAHEDLINKLQKCVKSKPTYREKRLFGTRYVVENYFSHIKRFNRLSIRRERKLDVFMNFLLFSNILYMCKKHNQLINYHYSSA